MAFLAPLLGAGAAGAAGASGVLGTIGAVASGVGTLASGLFAAQVAKNNAKIAMQNAKYARQAGQVQAQQKSLEGAEKLGAIRTAQAASGIDVNTGSAKDVQAGQRAISKLDTETVLQNAELEAYGYTTQASNFETQAEQDTVGGVLGGLGSTLSNVASVKWGSGGVSGAAMSSDPWAGLRTVS